MNTKLPVRAELSRVRAGCAGMVPLPARLEPWQIELCGQPDLLARWIEQYGSPLNLLDPTAFARNAGELQWEADRVGADLAIFFARKANKALAFVDEARRIGLGVDVASERELQQALESGIPAADLIVTAAVKPRALLELCVAAGATVTIDNEDELRLLAAVAERGAGSVPVALRLAPAPARGMPPSRFGLTAPQLIALVERSWPTGPALPLAIAGVHFHLDGYEAPDRVSGVGEGLELIDALRERGHRPAFIDMGGGVPMSYLDDRGGLGALLGRAPRGTARAPAAAHVRGPRARPQRTRRRDHGPSEPLSVLPGARPRGDWLAGVLSGEVTTRSGAQTVTEALWARGLQLRCEPGRSL